MRTSWPPQNSFRSEANERARHRWRALCFSGSDLVCRMGVARFGRLGCLRALFVALLDLEQFDVEDERGVGGDLRTWRPRTVGQLGGNPDLVLRADGHELQDLGPSLDDRIDRESGGLAALV